MKIGLMFLIIVVGLATNIFSQVQFTSHLVTNKAPSVETMYAEDIDGDGDLDVLSALYVYDEVKWYQNDGNGNFTEFLISSEIDGPRSVYAYDIDGDGDMDVQSVSHELDGVVWYENDGSENFTYHLISTNAKQGTSVFAIDGDGDVLSTSQLNSRFFWY